ncbi:MAG: amino acid permease [Patescibacteria group bacterium]
MAISKSKTKKYGTAKFLGVFTLAMINVSLICNLRGLPIMATYGLSIIFFLLIAVVFFLIPTAFISAELASTFPGKGGIYHWVRQAFGERWAFVAISLQWLQNLFFFTTALAAGSAVLAFLINPKLAQNPYFTIAVIIVFYWGSILINLRGMKASGRLANFGSTVGLIFPGIALLAIGLIWVFTDQSVAIPISWQAAMPNLSNIGNFVFLGGLFLYFAGTEVSAVHVNEVKNPQKDYPKAILISSVIIILVFLFGALAIAMIVPKDQISLTAGLMEAFYVVSKTFNISWLIPVVVLVMAPGMMVQVSSWIAGPSRGLFVAAQNGDLPRVFQKMNKHDMPVNIMLVQGAIVTLISLLFVFSSTVSSGFWFFTAISAILYLFVYIIMFLTGIKLRKKFPDKPRPFSVPGGRKGMWFFAGLGILACAAGIPLSTLPSSELTDISLEKYIITITVLAIFFIALPFVIFALRKPSWKISGK